MYQAPLWIRHHCEITSIAKSVPLRNQSRCEISPSLRAVSTTYIPLNSHPGSPNHSPNHSPKIRPAHPPRAPLGLTPERCAKFIFVFTNKFSLHTTVPLRIVVRCDLPSITRNHSPRLCMKKVNVQVVVECRPLRKVASCEKPPIVECRPLQNAAHCEKPSVVKSRPLRITAGCEQPSVANSRPL